MIILLLNQQYLDWLLLLCHETLYMQTDDHFIAFFFPKKIMQILSGHLEAYLFPSLLTYRFRSRLLGIFLLKSKFFPTRSLCALSKTTALATTDSRRTIIQTTIVNFFGFKIDFSHMEIYLGILTIDLTCRTWIKKQPKNKPSILFVAI